MAIPSPKLRVMVDANVLLAGHGWARWSFEVLRHTVAEDYQLVLSADVIDEVRKHISRRFPHLLERLEAFLTDVQYELVASPSEDEVKQHSGLVRDAKDVPIAVAAITAGVDCFVSSDKDFTESEELKQRVRVILPAVFLREYMGWTSEQLEAIRYRNWDELE